MLKQTIEYFVHTGAHQTDLSSFEIYFVEEGNIHTECANVAIKYQRCEPFIGVCEHAPPENFVFLSWKMLSAAL